MGSFAIIPLIALLFYALMFCVFAAAKKNQLIKCFCVQLFFLMLWSGGSFLMRTQFLGQIAVWYHISLAGIWIGCVIWDYLMSLFEEKRITLAEKILALAVIAILIANVITSWFLAPPQAMLQADGSTTFVYGGFTVGTYLMYAILLAFFIIIIARLVGCKRNRTLTTSQFIPLSIGSATMILCNIAIILPPFSGIPLDIAAGIIFAGCIFTCLYHKHLFSLTLAFSRRTYTMATAAIIILFATQLTRSLFSLFQTLPFIDGDTAVVCVSLATVVFAAGIYQVISKVSENLFMREYNSRSMGLESFNRQISGSLDTNEVSTLLSKQIADNLRNVSDVRTCLMDDDGAIRVTGSTDLLEVGSKFLNSESAVFSWLGKHKRLLAMDEFARSFESRIIWEEERMQLARLGTDYVMPLVEGESLLGAVYITMKDSSRKLNISECEYLSSLSVVAAASIKNSQLYQKVALDAMTDDMTGLLNRKHFLRIMGELVEENPSQIMSLMIINIDDFKLYNQLYGQAAADETLRRIATVISTTVGEGNYIARYSGKEFAVLMPGQESSSAKRLADNLHQQIYDLNRNSNDESPLKILTCSIGICSIPFDAHTQRQLLENADMAVYQVKQHGKNGVMVYSTGEVTSNDAEEPLDHESIYSNYASTIYALAAAIDAKDHYTFTHSNNVAYYAAELARAYGLNADTIELVREAGLLHDIGKIGIPENILNKPDRLTAEEYKIIQRHPENAVAIIRHLPSLDYVIPAVVAHHERWDGKGYPRQLAGEDIPLTARILAVGDVFDAVTTKRCYQDPRSIDVALRIMEDGAGIQFDPELVMLFVEKVKDGTIKVQFKEA